MSGNPDDLETRLARLEQTVETHQQRIADLETQLAAERQAHQDTKAQLTEATDTIAEQGALLDALTKKTATTREQVAELQSRELEKGAHLRHDTVDPSMDHLDVPGDHLERFTDRDETARVRLPDHEDPIENRTEPKLSTADLLPIQQLARLPDDLLASTTSRRADYLAAKAWDERGRHDRSTLWSAGCGPVTEYVDASDVRTWIKTTHERPDESLSYDHAKKLAGQTLERLRELSNHRCYVEKRTHRKDGLKYKERRLVVPTDADIPGEPPSNHGETPGKTDVPG